MLRFGTYLSLLLLIGLLPACTDCGPSAEVEPQVSLRLIGAGGKRFRPGDVAAAIYGVGAIGQQPLATLPNPSDTTRYLEYMFTLPLNVRADQTRYVLAGQNRRDTVTINYRRVFTYKDNECGYLMDVQAPPGYRGGQTDVQLAGRSTIGRISGIYYEGTQLVGNGWAPARLSNSGIYVTLLLP